MQTLTGRETVALSEPIQSNGTKATDSTPATVNAIHAAICEAAYFIAQRRGFQPGHETIGWRPKHKLWIESARSPTSADLSEKGGSHCEC
jgi:hypothetical protein